MTYFLYRKNISFNLFEIIHFYSEKQKKTFFINSIFRKEFQVLSRVLIFKNTRHVTNRKTSFGKKNDSFSVSSGSGGGGGGGISSSILI